MCRKKRNEEQKEKSNAKKEFAWVENKDEMNVWPRPMRLTKWVERRMENANNKRQMAQKRRFNRKMLTNQVEKAEMIVCENKN